MGRISNRICCIKDCDKLVHGAGMCRMHHQRLKRHGNPTISTRFTAAECSRWLYDHRLHEGEECLTYPFLRNSGYGDSFSFTGLGMRTITPHRFMCLVAHGNPPTPKYVAAHSCGRGKYGCVNPRHLRWATYGENTEDKRLHGTMPLGEGHVNAKLTEADVREIRSLRGKMTQRAIAEKFGISIGHTCQLQKGGRWWRSEHTPTKEYLRSTMRTGRKRGVIR